MKTLIAIAGIAMAVSMGTVSVADACSRNVSSQASGTYVPTKGINQNLLSAAVRTEVNFHRCRAGLRQLGDAGSGLTKQSGVHSGWMAKHHKLSHKSTVRGSATLKHRLNNAGVKFRTGAENIGMVSRYQIDSQRFKIVNANACQFVSNSGQALPAHSYASLARHIVNLWMNSAGHRKNILNRKVTHVSTAVAFDPRSPYCGKFWLTQAFVG